MQYGGGDLLGEDARPSGSSSRSRAAFCSGVSPGRLDIGVSTGPGLTALIRTPSRMWSSAAVLVSTLTAALLAA